MGELISLEERRARIKAAANTTDRQSALARIVSNIQRINTIMQELREAKHDK
jgi:hypothetical protein